MHAFPQFAKAWLLLRIFQSESDQYATAMARDTGYYDHLTSGPSSWRRDVAREALELAVGELVEALRDELDAETYEKLRSKISYRSGTSRPLLVAPEYGHAVLGNICQHYAGGRPEVDYSFRRSSAELVNFV